jgi:hypothetical protein
VWPSSAAVRVVLYKFTDISETHLASSLLPLSSKLCLQFSSKCPETYTRVQIITPLPSESWEFYFLAFFDVLGC